MLLLLVDPRARGAYFAQTLEVAAAEARCVLGCEPTLREVGPLRMLAVDVEAEVAPRAARLSFVQAVLEPAGDGFNVVDADSNFVLPEELVWSAKYRGKTHEIVTQLAVNVALSTSRSSHSRTLLDPMAGRGTTLLWGARYGLSAVGVERDPKARDHLVRDLGRVTKLHRIKHALQRGSVHKKRKDGVGAFVDVRFGVGGAAQLITGDTRELSSLVGNRRFAMLVTDLPYGVQFTGGEGRRGPLEIVRSAAPGWVDAMETGGSLVVVYNRLLPKRAALASVFEAQGLTRVDFEAGHRVSESIRRDLVVFRRD